MPFKREFRVKREPRSKRPAVAGIEPEGGIHYVSVLFEPQGCGRFGEFRVSLLLDFGAYGAVMRELIVDVADPDMAAAVELDEVERPPPVWDSIERRVIPAFPGARPNAGHLKTPDDVAWHPDRRLGLYAVPEKLQDDIDRLERTKFNPWRTRSNYAERTHTLLYIEEAQQVKNFRRFDVAGVSLHMNEEGGEVWHKLMLEGLAERRPSVLKGDSVFVWVPGTQDVEYEGYVQEVLRDAAWLQLNPCFADATHGVPEFNVRFSFSRIQFRRMHSAIDNVDLSLVWPEGSATSEACPPTDVTSSTDSWTPNDQQRECMARISALAQQPMKHPFLVRGAFGTGKTSTLCNVVLQLLRGPCSGIESTPEAPRVLLCTECNAAADLYISLLADKLAPHEMLRYYQAHRRTGGMSNVVWRYCEALFDGANEIFRVPAIAELLSYRLIVCTFDNSAVLWGIGCLKGMFSHIFMDEVANALEPRALIPLQLADQTTAIVMAGDDRQIAPQVQSPSARHHGLKQSMLVRLVGLEFYRSNAGAHVEVQPAQGLNLSFASPTAEPLPHAHQLV